LGNPRGKLNWEISIILDDHYHFENKLIQTLGQKMSNENKEDFLQSAGMAHLANIFAGKRI
jgi:hypothetical protein